MGYNPIYLVASSYEKWDQASIPNFITYKSPLFPILSPLYPSAAGFSIGIRRDRKKNPGHLHTLAVPAARTVSITNAVREKGTIFKPVPSYLTAFLMKGCRRSSSAPSGSTFPKGEGIASPNSNSSLSICKIKYATQNPRRKPGVLR